MEHVIIWEQEPLVKPEFRLYYDDKGKVIDGVVINYNNFDLFLDSRKIKN